MRVDRGVENFKVCDAMVAMRGSGRGSFIAGLPQETKELKGFGGICSATCAIIFTEYSMQWNNVNSLIFDNMIHMFLLHLIFILCINHALEKYQKLLNDHKIRTAGNWSPNQLWHKGMLDSTTHYHMEPLMKILKT